MALTLNLGDLLKTINDHGNADRAAIGVWLFSLAAEAAVLAKTWGDTYAELYNTAKFKSPKFESLDLIIQMGNVRPHSNLEAFYRMTSRALHGKYKYQEELVHALGSLLRERNVTKDAFEKAVRSAVLRAGEGIDIEDLGQHIRNLHQHAAVLYALAKSFKS